MEQVFSKKCTGKLLYVFLSFFSLTCGFSTEKTAQSSESSRDKGKKGRGALLSKNVAKDSVLRAKFVGGYNLSTKSSPSRVYSVGELLAFRRLPILVVLWSPSCRPCVGELPSLDKFQKMFSGKIDVVPICIDSSRQGVGIGTYTQKSIRHVPYFDLGGRFSHTNFFPQEISQRGIPFMMIYDPQGKRVFQHMGSVSFEDLVSTVERLKIVSPKS
jgi:thiol-disulfide isomerase/thioredoxin